MAPSLTPYRPRIVLVAAAAMCFAAAPAAHADGANKLSRVEGREEGAAATVLSIHGSATPTFTLYKLDKPERLVVDVANADAAAGMAGSDGPALVGTWAVNQLLVQELGGQESGVARFVFTFARPSLYTVAAKGNDVVVTVTAREARPQVPATTAAPNDAALKKQLEEAKAEAAKARAEADAAKKAAAAAQAGASKRDADAMKREAELNQRIATAEAARDAAGRRAADAEAKASGAQTRATDAAKRIAAAEAAEKQAAAKIAEAEKRADATAKKEAELERKNAIAAKKDAELAARSAETDRKAAEAQRASAQAAQVTADASRVKAEAEAQKKAAAELKLTAERTLKEIEARRAEADAAKKTADARALDAEKTLAAARARAEAAEKAGATDAAKKRAEAEKALAQVEARRKEAEQATAAAEARTIEAQQKKSDIEARQRDAEVAAKAAEGARQTAITAQRDEEARIRTLSSARADEERRLASLAAARKQEEDAMRRAEAARAKSEAQAKEAADALAKVQQAKKNTESAKLEADKTAKAKADAQRKADALAERAAAKAEIDAARAEVAKLEAQRLDAEKAVALRQKELAGTEQRAKTVDGQRAAADREVAMAKQAAEGARAARESEETRAGAVRGELALEEQKLAEARKARIAEEAKLAATREAAKAAAAQVRVASVTPVQPPVRTSPVGVTPAPTVASGPVKISNVGLVDRADSTRVVLEMSGGAQPVVVAASGRQAILDIPNAELPAALEKVLDARAGGPVRRVSSYRDPRAEGRVRVVVELATATEGTLHHQGSTWTWEFPKAAVSEGKVATRSSSWAPPIVGAYGVTTTPVVSQTVAQMKRKVYRGKRIDLNFKDVDIHNLLRLLAEVGGVNVVVPDDVKATVTVRLTNVPWDQAMEVVLASKELWYRREGNLIRVAPRKQLDAEDQAEADRQKARASAEAPEPEVFTLNYATAREMSDQVGPLLSPKGKVEVDERTNSLIINDIRAHRERAIALLSRLDTQTPQIQIEARVVEARSNWSRELGVQWGTRLTQTAATGNPTGLIFPSDFSMAGGAIDQRSTTTGVLAANPDFAVNLPAAVGAGAGGAGCGCRRP